ncbi:flagellar hook-basal body complex protein [Peptococcaceae bacterium 1198_IL3148]
MIRSLYSGVSGMKNHQIRMDVTGNNIANVNTTGFKKGRANFQDTLYQTISSGGNSKNPAQVGAGMSVGSINNDFGQGATQNTGRTLDMAIQGDGFFAVSNAKSDLITAGNVTPKTDPADLKANYTREGVFFVDKDGYIVNSGGMNLIGQTAGVNTPNDKSDDAYGAIRVLLEDDTSTPAVPLSIEALTISPDGKITGTYTNGNPVKFDYGSGSYNDSTSLTEARIAIVTFANNEGLIKEGQNVYKENVDTSGAAVFGVPNGESQQINSGYLEMSNVDLTEEFTTMITTQRGYQANARVITTSDSMLEELINLKR